jgi:glycosyltransferase involved in cell wall biosynthesis
MILDSIKKIKDSFSDLEVVAPFGSFNRLFTSSYEQYLRNEISRKGLDKVIKIKVSLPVDEVIKEMLSSDIVLIPSLVENASATLCEAQYLGVPIIAAFTGGMTELFEHEKSGFYYNPLDGDVLVMRVTELLRSKSLRKEFSREGIILAKKRHDRMKNYSDLKNIYKQICELK